DLGADIDALNGYTAVALTGDASVGPGSNRVQITTTTLPDAQLNTPYRQAIACSGGFAQCAWQIVTSLLPDGTTFDTAAGAVTGTPTSVQTGNVTVTAYDPTWPSNTTTATLTLTVDPPPLVLTMSPPATGQVGAAYALTPSVSGVLGVATWSVVSGALPAGVGLDATCGAILGTPSQWGTTTAVVQVADSFSPARLASQPVTITVAPSALSIASTALASAIYQQPYAATLVGAGGSGSTVWSLVSGSLPPGSFFTPAARLPARRRLWARRRSPFRLLTRAGPRTWQPPR